jgi:peptidoglycan hydrolase-like amidase
VYKPSNKGGRWDEAVDATRGWVLIAGGKPMSAWYASTSGGYQQSYTANGYSTPGFWDTTSDWTHWADGAYESKAGSPWFYKGWYKDRSGDSCGRSHPWLTESEFADVLNAWVVRYNGSGDEVAKIIPMGSCWASGGYSQDELKNVANKYGGAFTSVSSISIQHSSDGYTKNVIVNTNRGSVTISGPEFKTAFNLRAPGRLSIKGDLFSIEKK